MRSTFRFLAVLTACSFAATLRGAAARIQPGFDFAGAQSLHGWEATNDVSGLRATADGMAIDIAGDDPYVTGPPRDFPPGVALRMMVRIKSDQPGTAEVFYFPAADAGRIASVTFPVPRAGEWVEAKRRLPPLGAGYRFRIDPPGKSGGAVVASLAFEPRPAAIVPAWPKPELPKVEGAGVASAVSGDVEVRHRGKAFGGFEVRIGDTPMAVGLSPTKIGYVDGADARWLDVAGDAEVGPLRSGDGLYESLFLADAGGAKWHLSRRFRIGKTPGSIDIDVEVQVDRDRSVMFLPMLVLLPGAGSFGGRKTQGLLAGLEYLDDEPSSSEADVVGAASKRQVPDSLKITFPLMAVCAAGRYVGLIWDKPPGSPFSAAFDSPDRLFGSGGHVMGVLAPGSDGANRVEGNLLADDPITLRANEPLKLSATLIGGAGTSVVPAVRRYVELRGLPPVPDVGMDARQYVAFAAGGWLDSKIREGDLVRHAYWSGFNPHPAADAPAFMQWLGRQTDDAALAERLDTEARLILAKVDPPAYNTSKVGHIAYPLPALLYGHVAENARGAEERGRRALRRFEPDGALRYQPRPNGTDYGRTHPTPEANGHTANAVAEVLQSAAFSGDKELIAEGVRLLRAMDKFTGSVPRGAQTWEVPLHTPDVLASAHLVRAYTLGYELTGEEAFLEKARHWAWTGVPFVYLVNPTGHRVGAYATIPVLGATNWTNPVWLGLPVQWCGLVYADALYRLARHDASGPWEQLADGIAASGVQQSFPATDPDRRGLLPDLYHLRQQVGDGPAINPGTVQVNAARLFKLRAMYDFRSFRRAGLLVHAPGAIVDEREEARGVSFKVDGWSNDPYYLLITGLKKRPAVRVDGAPVTLEGPHGYEESEGRVVLKVQGSPRIDGLAE